ncbi:glutaredoxin family protein [Aestuariibacter halophilus]|uniref:Glutaredoxin family protein n=1 Tax=Fluctibacter halophilus TaxID=226011 RepID=A0ABS8G5B1_9ALTE|nr:glutaredoxin family protein [Aestuariibacter halophilus]MCC2615679.1 glutaredoxin family protein [Aestuariibacter halophilus]
MSDTTKPLILFSGTSCPLCDTAKQMIDATLIDAEQLVEVINVRDDHDLYHQYGARIPVFYRTDSREELPWPFDQQQLIEFLS